MQKPVFRKIFMILGVFFCLWLTFRYLLVLFLPFLLGGLLSVSAEPIVNFFHRRLKIPRIAGAFLGITMALSMVALVFLILGALALRQLRSLAFILPDLTEMLQTGLSAAENQLLSLAMQAPAGASAFLQESVSRLFSDGSALISSGMEKVLRLATGVLGRIPGGAIGLGTGILSAFMISARLPRIKARIRQLIPRSRLEKFLPALQEIRSTVSAWAKTQLKLAVITFSIVCSGCYLLRIRYAPAVAAIVALVDAVPMLGTGTVMVPWAVVELILGNRAMALGLLGTYACASLTRSILEPRMLGQHLGLDPLMTLLALYLGFRLWGVAGMILSPMAAVVAIRLAELYPGRKNIPSS